LEFVGKQKVGGETFQSDTVRIPAVYLPSLATAIAEALDMTEEFAGADSESGGASKS
jgi:hypothetical protein